MKKPVATTIAAIVALIPIVGIGTFCYYAFESQDIATIASMLLGLVYGGSGAALGLFLSVRRDLTKRGKP